MKKILLVLLVVSAGSMLAVFFIRQVPQPSSNNRIIFHYSYFSQPKFYDEAYRIAKASAVDYLPKKAIIVNHHLLAANFIAETFNQVATISPMTVLLISPNHFDAGRGAVITSEAIWKTPFGELEPNNQLINQLTTQGLASAEEPPFEQEHGISGIVAFVKKSLPNAKVVPLIFKNRMSLEQSQKLADEYYQLLPKNTFIVGSFDFSHYLTSNAADFHDIESLAAIESFDFQSIYNLDIDSRPGLAFFLELLKNSGSQNFHLLENSNSAKLVKKDILETTSYIDGYFTQPQFSEQDVVKNIKTFETKENNGKGQSMKTGAGFTPGPAATSLADTLLSLPSIDIGPQNSSALDKRAPKYALTYLERLLFGQNDTMAFWSLSDSIESERDRLALSRLGLDLTEESYRDYELGKAKVRLINCAKRDKGEERAKRAVEEGADAVICQGAAKNFIEFYKNKPIIYASGKLLDSQTLTRGGKSLAVGLASQNGRLKIFLFPIGALGGQLKLLVGKESDKVLAEMARSSKVSLEIQKQIQQGIISIEKSDKN